MRQRCTIGSYVQLPFSRSPSAPGPPLKTDPGHGKSSLGRAVRRVSGHVIPGGTPFHSKAPARLIAVNPLHCSQCPPVFDGTTRLQSPVSLVYRALHRRQGLGPFRLFQEVGAEAALSGYPHPAGNAPPGAKIPGPDRYFPDSASG